MSSLHGRKGRSGEVHLHKWAVQQSSKPHGTEELRGQVDGAEAIYSTKVKANKAPTRANNWEAKHFLLLSGLEELMPKAQMQEMKGKARQKFL